MCYSHLRLFSLKTTRSSCCGSEMQESILKGEIGLLVSPAKGIPPDILKEVTTVMKKELWVFQCSICRAYQVKTTCTLIHYPNCKAHYVTSRPTSPLHMAALTVMLKIYNCRVVTPGERNYLSTSKCPMILFLTIVYCFIESKISCHCESSN